MNGKETSKTCFVIAPIGEDESIVRKNSDDVLKYIIKPIASNCGYKAIRADEVSKPGVITSQIIQHIIQDDLVIADLTDENPNVFYELAIRHFIKKPFIQITQSQGKLPFDIAQIRTIYFESKDMGSVEACKTELERQIKAIEEDPDNIDSPISMAINWLSLRNSDNLLEKSNAEILAMLQDILGSVHDVREQFDIKPQNIDKESMDQLYLSIDAARPTLAALMHAKEGCTVEELSEKTGRSIQTELNIIYRLLKAGYIKKEYEGRKKIYAIKNEDIVNDIFGLG
jgi:DNA-binding transcriptional ArsR family regulator